MDATVARGGKFTFTIEPKEFVRGLRPTKRTPRNSGFLITCEGAVGRDGTLQALDTITRIDTTELGALSFPYPQLFIFSNVIIVCISTAIYESLDGDLVTMLDSLTPGVPWSAMDFGDFIYLTNGQVAVTKRGGVYAIDSTVPYGTCACNYLGQALLGGIDQAVKLGEMVPINIISPPITISTRVVGLWTSG